MNSIPAFVTNDEDVIQNIVNFNKEAQIYKQSDCSLAITRMIDNMSHYRAWYCFLDEETDQYLFGPSKYVGYKDMSAEIYNKYNYERAQLDGRKTEIALANWYERVEAGHPDHKDLFGKLNDFCASFGKAPNSLCRINVIRIEKKTSAKDEDLVNLIFKVYEGLPYDSKNALKQKILNAK